jgi:7-keto-8-aminopelargonate synthetase-like enzyme
MTDLLSKFDPLIEQRRALLSTGLTDPFGLVMERVLSPTVAVCNGRETILLGTYNYMGMTFDDDVIRAGKQAFDDFGAGTTGSRVLNGTFDPHRDVEAALREFYAMDHAMVFSTGYQANLGIISTITSSSTSTAMHPSMTGAKWAMPKLSHSATMMLRRWKSD